MNISMTAYGCLFVAIACEVIGTSALKYSEQFTKLVPTVVMAASYLCAFYFLSRILHEIPVGVAYALWSGLGIVLVSMIGFFVFKQKLDLAACIGLGLIVAGVVIVNLFSGPGAH